MEDSFKMNKYYQRGFEEGKKIGEQEGLDKAWAAARFSQGKILLKLIDILIVLMLI